MIKNDQTFLQIDFKHCFDRQTRGVDAPHFSIQRNFKKTLKERQMWKYFKELCVRAFKILRRRSQLLIRICLTAFRGLWFTELEMETWLMKSFRTNETESAALAAIPKLINEGVSSIQRKLKSWTHKQSLARHRKKTISMEMKMKVSRDQNKKDFVPQSYITDATASDGGLTQLEFAPPDETPSVGRIRRSLGSVGNTIPVSPRYRRVRRQRSYAAETAIHRSGSRSVSPRPRSLRRHRSSSTPRQSTLQKVHPLTASTFPKKLGDKGNPHRRTPSLRSVHAHSSSEGKSLSRSQRHLQLRHSKSKKDSLLKSRHTKSFKARRERNVKSMGYGLRESLVDTKLWKALRHQSDDRNK
mmetsp:Transcript_11013/g.21670  ORF Transcript_11013/g.21670 Transcript_11013/m.21670 type:complete len:356 (-) Transcript_11013:176-1243(-)